MLVTVAIFLIILGILVFVHEFGHFICARKLGMKVEEFGFGFPPKIWSKTGKDGVVYSINTIPLGGFCKIKGEDGENRNEPDSFASKKPWRRAIVLTAGVAMNFLLCAFLLSIGFLIGLPTQVDSEMVEQGIVQNYKMQVVGVLEGLPAQKAGLETGDMIVSVNGNKFSSIKNLNDYTKDKLGQTLSYEINRKGEIITKDLEIVQIDGGKTGIGVSISETGIVRYPVHLAVYEGFKLTGKLTKLYVVAFYDIIKNLIVGKPMGVQVSGPVAKLGFMYLLQLVALLSLNLAIINILPFPALDGGRLLFLAIEKIRRKPVSQKVESTIHTIGFALLMILIIVVTFQDVLRYVDFGKIFSGFF